MFVVVVFVLVVVVLGCRRVYDLKEVVLSCRQACWAADQFVYCGVRRSDLDIALVKDCHNHNHQCISRLVMTPEKGCFAPARCPVVVFVAVEVEVWVFVDDLV